VRVIDSVAVYKDAAREMEVMHLSNLTKQEAVELGSKVAALIGLGIEDEEAMETGAEIDAEMGTERLHAFSDEEASDILEEIPNDTAAALILLEHHWAVSLRDAILRAGGVDLADGVIHPVALVAIGVATEAEAAELSAMHPSATAQVGSTVRHSRNGGGREMMARRVARGTSRRVTRRRQETRRGPPLR
jgi:hypothetical protein